jgi:hypothetical protein
LPGETIRIDRITGNKIIEGGKRRSAFKPLPKIDLAIRSGIPGLHAFEEQLSIKFVWIRAEEITEPDARDAQCRAGWSDAHEGRDFLSFDTFRRADGLFEASWRCWRNTE